MYCNESYVTHGRALSLPSSKYLNIFEPLWITVTETKESETSDETGLLYPPYNWKTKSAHLAITMSHQVDGNITCISQRREQVQDY